MIDNATHKRQMRELAESTGSHGVIAADIFATPQPLIGTGGFLGLVGIALRWRRADKNHDLPEKVLVVVDESGIRFVEAKRTMNGWKTGRTVRVLRRAEAPIERSTVSPSHFVFRETGDAIDLGPVVGSGAVAAEVVDVMVHHTEPS